MASQKPPGGVQNSTTRPAAYVAQHKGVLAGLVTKCRPMPADAAGLVVEFMCPPGGF